MIRMARQVHALPSWHCSNREHQELLVWVPRTDPLLFPRESTHCTVDSQALFTLVYRITLPYILSKPNETIIFLFL